MREMRHYLTKVFPGPIFLKPPFMLHDVIVQVATVTELKYQV